MPRATPHDPSTPCLSLALPPAAPLTPLTPPVPSAPAHGAARSTLAAAHARWGTRLQAAGLRPTRARVAVLAVLDRGSGVPECADALLRELLDGGTPLSLATVYRTVQQLARHGLVEESWDAPRRRATYRLNTPQPEQQRLRILCHEGDCGFELDAPGLHGQLVEAARRQGLDLGTQALWLRVACAGAAQCGRAPDPATQRASASSALKSRMSTRR